MKLLEPGFIGNLEIKNRIIMAPNGVFRGNFAIMAPRSTG